MTLRVELLDEAAVAGLREPWDALVARGDDPRPYSRHSWLTARRRHFGRGRLITVTAWRGDELVGALPLEVTRSRGVTTATMVDGARGGYADLLVADGDAEAAQALAAALPGVGADVLAVAMYREGSAAATTLERLGMTRMPSLDSLRRLRLNAPWSEVEERLVSSRTRKDRRRRERRLAEQGTVERVLLREPEDIRAALPDAIRLHRLKWAGGSDGSALGTATGAAFWEDATVALAREGLARMLLLKLDGSVIAFELAFLLDGRLSTYRGQYDATHRHLGVGVMATLGLFLAVGESERIDVVEFGPGDEPWKQDLSTETLALPAGVLPLTARGRVDVAGRLAIAHARRRLKNVELVRKARAFLRERRAPAESRPPDSG